MLKFGDIVFVWKIIGVAAKVGEKFATQTMISKDSCNESIN